ncbi:MAG: hypothetical protein U5P41_12975 [Gammaproteobacteria bacterium]|nr:hypothetical protein [Gammaproteobacteria bacterium]
MAAVLAVLPPLRNLLEGSLIAHVLLQIPMLILAGASAGRALPAAWQHAYGRADPLGWISLLVALFTLAFWLLPRNLDLAVSDPQFAWLKYMSLFIMAGILLGLGGPRLPSLACHFLWTNAAAMLLLMGWLYSVAPVRLCTNYLISEQDQLATALLMLGALALLSFMFSLLTGGLYKERNN